jgi:hypothetical protein
MRRSVNRRRVVLTLILSGFMVAGFFAFGHHSDAMQEDKGGKKVMHEKAYKVYQNKCLGCHISIADPEKPGRTRDEWHIAVEVMHDYGLDLSNEESEMIIDLLYDLRKGMEKEAG